jgi:spermidine/putrescine-binding protein
VVHAYVFAQSVPQHALDAFTQSTGARVELTTYDSNEELISGLRARPGAYDLVMPSDYAVDALVAAGALRPLELAAIPNYNNITPGFLSPWFDPGGVAQSARGRPKNEKFSLPWLWGTTGIIYDPAAINPAPTCWADLWNPAYAGHLVLPDDPRELLGIALLALGYSKNDTSPAHLDAARDKLIPLVQGAVALDANTPETSLMSGPAGGPMATIGVVFSGNAVLARRGNPALRYVLPAEGAGIWFDNLAIPKDAPNPAAAQALINDLLSADNGVRTILDLPYSSPNEAALAALKLQDLPRWTEYTEDPISTPAKDDLSRAVPVKNVGPEAQARFEAAWAQVLAARTAGGAR